MLAYANYQFYFYGLNILRKSKIKSLSDTRPVFKSNPGKWPNVFQYPEPVIQNPC